MLGFLWCARGLTDSYGRNCLQTQELFHDDFRDALRHAIKAGERPSAAPKVACEDVKSKARATYRGVFLQRSICWHCDQPLGATYTSVESRRGFPLFVHYACRVDAERCAWPRVGA